MKTKEKVKKEFDSVEMMREIRNRIDKETAGMDFQQLKDFYKKSAASNYQQNTSNTQ